MDEVVSKNDWAIIRKSNGNIMADEDGRGMIFTTREMARDCLRTYRDRNDFRIAKVSIVEIDNIPSGGFNQKMVITMRSYSSRWRQPHCGVE